MSTHGSLEHAARLHTLVTSQLLKSVTSIKHIDELFLWLTQVVVQQLPAQVAELWAVQMSPSGPEMQLRAYACADSSVPVHIIINDQITAFTGRLLNKGQSYSFRPISQEFPSYQSLLLGRYGLYYTSGYVLNNNLLLPPPSKGNGGTHIPTPCMIVMLLFLKQSTPWNIQTTLGPVLEQALVIAGNHGLLLPVSVASEHLLMTPEPAHSNIFELIPHRLDTEILMSSNPFFGAASIDIADKQARRLYAAINGKSTIYQLCSTTTLEPAAVLKALHLLMKQQRVEIRDTQGRSVEAELLFSA